MISVSRRTTKIGEYLIPLREKALSVKFDHVMTAMTLQNYWHQISVPKFLKLYFKTIFALSIIPIALFFKTVLSLCLPQLSSAKQLSLLLKPTSKTSLLTDWKTFGQTLNIKKCFSAENARILPGQYFKRIHPVTLPDCQTVKFIVVVTNAASRKTVETNKSSTRKSEILVCTDGYWKQADPASLKSV